MGQAITKDINLLETDNILEGVLLNNHIAKLLTGREAEILRLLVSGKTNKEIARVLFRSERTVEYHRNRLMRKVGAHNAAELVKWAVDMRIV